MDEDSMEEQKMKELREKFRLFKLEEIMNRAREYKEQGKTKEEVKLMPNMNYLDDEELDKIFDEDNEQNESQTEENQQEEKIEGLVDEEKVDYEIEEEIVNTDYINDNEVLDKLEDDDIETVKKESDNQIVFLKDDELIDYEDQPFVTDVIEDNQELEESIKLNGIIEPIIVRPYNGKYQILSGHRRRMCGRNIGMTLFPCYIREKDDNEAKLYLVDTNLISRKNIKPSERAKAYRLKQEALKDKKLRAKVEHDILEDQNNFDLKEAMEKENNTSRTSIQRYLRINYLNKELQDAVDEKRINLNMAEQLSFLRKGEQALIAKMMNRENKKFTEGQIKKIRQMSNDETLSRENIEKLLKSKVQDFKISISFTDEQMKEFFNNERDYNKVRKMIYEKLQNKENSVSEYSVKSEL